MLNHGKEKVFHINMLKQYIVRETGNDVNPPSEFIASVIEVEDDEQDSLPETLNLIQKETYENVDINPNLPEDKKSDLENLVYEFRDIFTDVPKITNLGEHKVLLTSSLMFLLSNDLILYPMLYVMLLMRRLILC